MHCLLTSKQNFQCNALSLELCKHLLNNRTRNGKHLNVSQVKILSLSSLLVWMLNFCVCALSLIVYISVSCEHSASVCSIALLFGSIRCWCWFGFDSHRIRIGYAIAFSYCVKTLSGRLVSIHQLSTTHNKCQPQSKRSLILFEHTQKR